MKKLLIILLILSSVKLHAQNIFVSIGAGYSFKYNVPNESVEIGYINNMVISFDELIGISNTSYIPKIFKINAGYIINNFQPFISLNYQTIGVDNENYFKGTKYSFSNGYKLGGGITYYFKSLPLKITVQQQYKESNILLCAYTKF